MSLPPARSGAATIFRRSGVLLMNSEICTKSVSVLGLTGSIINFAALLARRDLPLRAFFMEDSVCALSSVLLLGCPAYGSPAETVSHGDLVFIEDELILRGAEPVISELRSAVESAGPDTEFAVLCTACADGEEGEGGLKRRIEVSAAESGQSRGSLCGELLRRALFLRLAVPLPNAGADVCCADERSTASGHEPLPGSDYGFAGLDAVFQADPSGDGGMQRSFPGIVALLASLRNGPRGGEQAAG